MDKPAPIPTAETRAFWAACARGALTFQRCETCGRAQFYPRALCHYCQGTNLSSERSAGRGFVYSFTVVHRAPSFAFRSDTPYVLALIELDEGLRIMTNVTACDPSAVRIGLRVEIHFEPRGPSIFLPQARPETP